jgi:hypothetical protein
MKNRSGAIARLVIWGLAAILLTAGLAMALTQPGHAMLSRLLKLDNSGWSGTSLDYADADLYQTGAGEAALRDCEEIEINWVSGNVKLVGAGGHIVRFSEDGAADEKEQLRYLVKDGKLTIQPCAADDGLSLHIPDKTLTVQVPYAELGKVTVRTTSADVTASGFQADGFEARTVSGGVRVNDVNAAQLAFGTTSGEIRAAGVQARETRADTTSGEIELSGELGALIGSSVSGGIRADSASSLRCVKLTTVSGSAALTVPDLNGFTVKFDTVSGSLKSDFSDRTPYVHGDGAADFTFRTVSGSVNLGPVNASAGR